MDEFLISELHFNFIQKFGGSFYNTIPDNHFVYDNDKEVYLVDEKKVSEMAEESLKINQNLFLLGKTLNFENKVI